MTDAPTIKSEGEPLSLTHFDASGRARMVDVGDKDVTLRVAIASGRWPSLATALHARHVRRVRGLAFQRAIAQLPRVDDRMLVLLWALAERWGRVGRDGVRVPVGLPHRTLATLVGARRPSVTTALTGLAREGLVERIEGGWLLHGDPDEVLRQRLLGAGNAMST